MYAIRSYYDLSFEQPRFEKDTYATIMENLNNQLKYIKTDNRKAFTDTISKVSSNYSNRTMLFNDELVKKIDFDKAVSIYKDRFMDASDSYNFV